MKDTDGKTEIQEENQSGGIAGNRPEVSLFLFHSQPSYLGSQRF